MAAEEKTSTTTADSLKKRIARLSFKFGARYNNFKADRKRDINTSLNFLTQAMILADFDEAEARRLMEMAKRITRE